MSEFAAVTCAATGMPDGVKAVVTTRVGGVSVGSYSSLNPAAHVDDDPVAVAENRLRLRRALDLPSEPHWLNQVHGTKVVCFVDNDVVQGESITADAAVTRAQGAVLAVLTADCLPVLFAAPDGSVIGAAHAGWRGLAAGVMEAALGAMGVPADEVVVWLGPAIGVESYEVGAEVHDAFADSPGFEIGFAPSERAGHWRCDLVALARARLHAVGVGAITGGEWDTFAERERFYSYRRDGQTGRMASLIWRENT